MAEHFGISAPAPERRADALIDRVRMLNLVAKKAAGKRSFKAARNWLAANLGILIELLGDVERELAVGPVQDK